MSTHTMTHSKCIEYEKLMLKREIELGLQLTNCKYLLTEWNVECRNF